MKTLALGCASPAVVPSLVMGQRCGWRERPTAPQCNTLPEPRRKQTTRNGAPNPSPGGKHNEAAPPSSDRVGGFASHRASQLSWQYLRAAIPEGTEHRDRSVRSMNEFLQPLI